ncbi:MAG: biotin--[acetyl-CoA-carboxylase] ligase [Chitinivibrionales bacterium]|nr:biotin--[acetyl-CoA-carboxylase] ligase [Chitinivibrionales bacterium]
MYTLYQFDSLESTNSYILDHADEYGEYSVVWAHNQTKGRGRFSRSWHSCGGKDLAFSLVVPLMGLEASLWPTVTQVACLGIVEALNQYDLDIAIKWPNDVIIKEKKLCGILAERFDGKEKPFCVVGIGVNVNSTALDLSDIPQPTTSLTAETGLLFDRELLLHTFLSNIIDGFSKLQRHGFESARITLFRMLAFRDRLVRITDGSRLYEGYQAALSETGTLILQLLDGSRVEMAAGEVSFLKDDSFSP